MAKHAPVIISHLRDEQKMYVLHDERALKEKRLRLQDTSRKNIQAVIAKHGMVGFAVRSDKIMSYKVISKVLQNELNYTRKYSEFALSALIDLSFSHHEIKDTLH
jgi:hypothetical protein